MAVRYYKGCDDLPIYNFQKIIETNNYAYLVYGWDENRRAFQDNDYCRELWDSIYNEYCKLTEDNASLMYYSLQKQLNYLKARYYIVSKLLDIMVDGTVLDSIELTEIYIQALKKWKYFIKRNKPIDEEIKRMYRELKISINKIELVEYELESFENTDEERVTFVSEVVGLEIALNKNEINPRTTSVSKWRAMIDKLKEKNSQMRRAS